MLGDADPQRLADTLQIVAADPGCDGLLVILSPQGMTDPAASAAQLALQSKGRTIPILASWMGGATVAAGAALLNREGIPTFHYPDTAARVFVYLWQYAANQRALYETPSLPPPGQGEIDRAGAAKVLHAVAAASRTLCTEWESKQLLAAYGIPTVRTELARTADDAAARAEAIGFPVVVKLNSETITHKTDVGGVRLNLNSSDSVRAAFREISAAVSGRFGESAFGGVTVQPMIRHQGYELILGASPDPQFGPVLLFGLGGELVEVFRDRALALPPLTTTLARRMMERTRIYRALGGVRGRAPVDLSALESLLVRFSQLVAEQPRIKEIDINPLQVSPEGCLALDARVVLYESSLPDAALPRLAIRPYPIQYDFQLQLRDRSSCHVRPIRPEDEPLMIRFHERLSDQTVYMRYLEMLKLDQRIAHERLARVCFIDYKREMALVALVGEDGKEEIVGVARLTKLHGVNQAEIAILIRDDFQQRGLGRGMLERLMQVALDEKLSRVVAFIWPDNIGMQKLATGAGMSLDRASDPDFVIASRDLD